MWAVNTPPSNLTGLGEVHSRLVRLTSSSFNNRSSDFTQQTTASCRLFLRNYKRSVHLVCDLVILEPPEYVELFVREHCCNFGIEGVKYPFEHRRGLILFHAYLESKSLGFFPCPVCDLSKIVGACNHFSPKSSPPIFDSCSSWPRRTYPKMLPFRGSSVWWSCAQKSLCKRDSS